MNTKNFTQVVENRRTIYAIGKSKISESRIQEIVEFAIKWAPSSFNSQTSRAVVLFGEQSDKFWSLTTEILRKIVPADQFAATEGKMKAFAAGNGTILFFEDQKGVKELQDKFPTYAGAFPGFSEHTSGIVQFIVWAALEAEGLGCSLQHYSPLVDESIQKEWGVPAHWKLESQMPFGSVVAPAGDKTFSPIEDRVKVFSDIANKQKVSLSLPPQMSKKDFAQVVKNRRTIYAIGKDVKISDANIQAIVEFAIKWAPSSFNSQTSRAVVLLGHQHERLWSLLTNIMQGMLPASQFAATEGKLKAFAAGYGTILFFEDQKGVKELQEKFPSYAAAFPGFSEHTSGMVQFIVWAALEAEGLGCSLQHYSPLIDESVQKEWGIPTHWKLESQMPFGSVVAPAGDKTFLPLEDRVRVFSQKKENQKKKNKCFFF